LIESIRGELKKLPGIFVTGSAYTGVGIPDCIRDGTEVAKEAVEYLMQQTKD
jgi:oxygen-dependent protoporphyrinogen oxidase